MTSDRHDFDDDEPPFTFGDELPPGRTLSQRDVEAIASALERRLARRIVTQAGRGVIRAATHGLLLAILLFAAYGIADGIFPSLVRSIRGH